MPNLRLPTAMLFAALVGGLVGALIAVVVIQPQLDGDDPSRGTTVRLSPEALFGNDETRVWCSDFHRFCIPHFEDPEDARALYLGDTHPLFRNAGSFVEWRPDFDVSGFETPPGTPDTGAFRGPGSGSTFLQDGTQIFGPSPRNLDEFPVEVVTETVERGDGAIGVTLLEVDTTHLICGDWASGVPVAERVDAECELAPPFD